jgi:hypothetical protein
MHYSQTHGYNADGGGIWTPLGAGGPFEALLRDEVNDLCLACHDGSASPPDVLAHQTGTVVRQAGALNRDNVAPYFDADGHTLGSTAIAPGSDLPWSNPDGFNCCDCHDQHGYHPSGNAFRNLACDPGNYVSPGVLVSYAVGTNNLAMDVFETAALDYSVDATWLNEPGDNTDAYANWCKGCHTDFHGAQGGGELGGGTGIDWLRHPPAWANIGEQGDPRSDLTQFTGHTNKVKVMNPNGLWDAPDDLTGSTPSCMSCHKAHGNQNAFGLIYMSGTGTVTEEGDDGTSATDLCGQCHVQG